MCSAEKYWYAVQTQPQREALAAAQLEKQGYAVFFPRRVKTVRHARRLQRRLVGYFPGYIFVSLDLDVDAWRSVNGTFGVRSLVMFGDRPARAPGGLINLLHSLTDEEGLISLRPDFAPGDRVRLLSGPFADMVGAMDRLEGGDRVRILLDLVGGRAPVVVDAENLALAS